MVGNTPGQKLKAGSMGRPLPGYRVALLDANGAPAKEGEICLMLEPRPTGLMQGYQADDGSVRAERESVYRTGDVAAVDDDGYLTYVGRADDVFKSSDYRISPFELESILDRASGGGRGGRGAVARSDAACRAEGFLGAGARPKTGSRHCVIDLSPLPHVRSRRSSGCGGSNSPNCRKRFPEKSGASSCGGPRRQNLEAGKRAPLEFWEDDFSDSELGCASREHKVTALGKLLRTTAFKLTLVYLAIFVLFAASLLGYFALNTRRLIDEQITSTVDGEINGLSEQYEQGGIRRLVIVVDLRSRRPGSSLYLVTTPNRGGACRQCRLARAGRARPPRLARNQLSAA